MSVYTYVYIFNLHSLENNLHTSFTAEHFCFITVVCYNNNNYMCKLLFKGDILYFKYGVRISKMSQRICFKAGYLC